MSNRFSGLRLRELASAPATPASGLGLLYVKNDGHIYSKNDAGTEYRLSGNDPALTDSGWIAPTLTNGWANYGSPFAPAGYRKIGDVVYLRGLVRNGTPGTSVFTLPAGYQPPYQLLVTAVSSANFGDVAGNSAASNPNITATVSSHAHGLQNHVHGVGSFYATMPNTGVRIDITTAGAVIPISNASSGYQSLDAINFLAN